VRRAAPRALGDTIRAVRADTAPRTLLAATQSVWLEALGERIAGEAHPTAERDGVITVSCAAATWAQELDLLQDELRGRLNEALAEGEIRALRFVVGDGSTGASV
jgi:predicted nucleic acid-binding Zn ribbon protein